MSSVIFASGSEAIGKATVDFDTSTQKAALIKTGTATTSLKLITAMTGAASPITVTSNSHGFANGDFVCVGGVLGNTAANGIFRVANQAANTFDLQVSLDGGATFSACTGNAAYTSGGYVVNLTAPSFVSSFTAAKVGTDQTLASKTTNSPLPGVMDAADPTWTAVADPGADVVGILLYQFGTADADSQVLAWYDGRVRVVCAATAAGAATSLAVEPLQAAIASGVTATFSNGVTATLSAGASVGARTLAVTALSAGIDAGNGADFIANPGSNQSLPIRPNGGNITFAVDAGQARLYSLRSYGLG